MGRSQWSCTIFRVPSSAVPSSGGSHRNESSGMDAVGRLKVNNSWWASSTNTQSKMLQAGHSELHGIFWKVYFEASLELPSRYLFHLLSLVTCPHCHPSLGLTNCDFPRLENGGWNTSHSNSRMFFALPTVCERGFRCVFFLFLPFPASKVELVSLGSW